MNRPVKIKSALISVYYKENLDPLIHLLNRLGVKIYSTEGTEQFIRELGVDVQPVEGITSYPSILDGRVKTLNPKVFGVITSRRDTQHNIRQLEHSEIHELNKEIEIEEE